jgi:hypothetical protein
VIVLDARRFLQSLVGRPLQTVNGRENRVLRLDGDSVVVWTTRSPAGQAVPIAWVQEALERIELDREIEISVQSVRYRSAFVGAVLRELPGAEVIRSVSPPRIRLSDPAPFGMPSTPRERVILLGCVKLKVGHRAPAKDLYRSPLWRGRRAYAEASGRPWLILSAEHGLVDPDLPLDPYDLALSELSASERRAWGERVVDGLERQFGCLAGMIFEIHAGALYRHAIGPGLAQRGASLQAPLGGLALGSQLAWYREHRATRAGLPDPRRRELAPASPRRRRSTPAEVDAAIRRLDTAPTRIPARDWPTGARNIDHAGLYSWWVDAAGASHLSSGLEQLITTGRIYAGQTGATKWPSGKAGNATLASRTGAGHLHGRIRGSTFRLTLASCLITPLELERIGRLQLAAESERRLTAWIADHLEVAVHPVDDRDPLSDLERNVLAELDPVLNLEGMPRTAVRSALSLLRARLAR